MSRLYSFPTHSLFRPLEWDWGGFLRNWKPEGPESYKTHKIMKYIEYSAYLCYFVLIFHGFPHFCTCRWSFWPEVGSNGAEDITKVLTALASSSITSSMGLDYFF